MATWLSINDFKANLQAALTANGITVEPTDFQHPANLDVQIETKLQVQGKPKVMFQFATVLIENDAPRLLISVGVGRYKDGGGIEVCTDPEEVDLKMRETAPVPVPPVL